METTNQISSLDQNLWFVSQNLESNSQTFYTVNNHRVQAHHHFRFDELRGRRIQACFHGWLILSDHSDNTLWSLWNPLTSHIISLPPLFINNKENDHSFECCLSSPPKDQASVFILLSVQIRTIYICLLGGKELKWTSRSYDKQIRRITGGYNSLLQSPTACCNGKLYAIALGKSSSYKCVVQIDIVVNNEEAAVNLSPVINIPRNRFPLRNICLFLKGSGTELFYIEVGFGDKLRKTIDGVSLFKLDMISKKWEEMVELENGVFFLQIGVASGGGCYYNYVVDMELRGYVHIVSECGKGVYSFHVKDRSLSLNSLSSQGESTCAMLEWRLEVDHPEEDEEHNKDSKIVVVRSPVIKDVSDNTNVFGRRATGKSHLLNMPLNILEYIMEYLIGVEYMKFRATCKHLSLAAPSIQWSKNTRIKGGYSLVLPWLMVLDNYRDTITFIDPLFGDKYFIKTPQQLKGGYEIHCSKYGWLLMYKKSKSESRPPMFFNPFTGNICELPEVNNIIESFCFSAPPTSPDCMVVGFSTGQVFIHYVSAAGEPKWHLHNLNLDLQYPGTFGGEPYSFHFPTFNDDYTYALCNNQRLLSIGGTCHEDYYISPVGNQVPTRSRARYFLTSCDQHILLVIVGEFGGSVEVFEADTHAVTWDKIDDLGKHMICICNTSCFCFEAKSSEMGNKIFFSRLLNDDDDNTKIVFYSLETCRYHTFSDKKMQESFGADLFGTKELCHPQAWIEPSWS